MFGLDGQAVTNTNDDSSATPPVVEPGASEPENSSVTMPAADPASVPDVPETPTSDLEDIKKRALKDLSPLVDQLDETPEQKFNVTMMMIQADNDKSLISKAYEAARAIKDDKVRAQALYDLVQEINYFRSHSD